MITAAAAACGGSANVKYAVLSADCCRHQRDRQSPLPVLAAHLPPTWTRAVMARYARLPWH